MGIWIRSQDGKGLTNPQDVYVARRAKTWAICANRGIDLGNYSTEEKALKVLDMIEKKIIEIDKTKFYGVQETTYKDNVFKAPKDEEV